jgi:D-amino-acid dehydrogenase
MSKHVLVVGAGIVGLSVAFACSQRGHRVTLIERSGAERGGCSFVNAGMIVPSHFVPLASPGMLQLGLRWMWNPESPFYVKPRLSAALLGWAWKFHRASTKARVDRAAPILRDLHLASREIYREWSRQWGDDFNWTERGMLMLCNTERGLDDEIEAAMHAQRLGMDARILTPVQAAELEPNLRMAIAGAVHFPVDCHMNPVWLMAALGREVERAGVEVSYDSVVSGWRTKGNRIEAVRMGRGGRTQSSMELSADEYVICAGIWSDAIAGDLGVRIPMQAGKGYSLTMDEPPSLPRVGAILSEGRVAMTPMGSSLRFAGTMELGGIDERIDPARVRGLVKSVAAYLPDFKPEALERATVRTGLRPVSPDGLPYVGRVSRYVNLSVATGHAMMGMSLGPISGKLIAEMLSGDPPSCGLDGLSPDRYAH